MLLMLNRAGQIRTPPKIINYLLLGEGGVIAAVGGARLGASALFNGVQKESIL